MTKIAFINPSYGPGHYSRASRSPAVTKSGTVYYPLWLAYAAGLAEDRGHEVTLIDAAAKMRPHTDVVRELTDAPPDVVVLDTTTPSIASDLKLAGMVRDAVAGAKIVAVGTHATALAEEVLGDCPSLDAVARGEYDETIAEYAETSSPADVAGLTYRDGDEIKTGPDRELLKDLDSLPFAARVYKDHLDIRDYFWSTALYPMVMTITGRGCPNRCAWCLYPQTMHGRGFRYRSPESVVDEFEYVTRELPSVREIGIEDDTFTARKSRARAICELLLKRGIKMRWWADVRADLDYETMELMKRAGCRLFIVGFEAGSQKVLDNMHKDIKIEQAEAFMVNARKLRVPVRACFVVGQLGETAAEMRETLDMAIRLDPDTAQFFPLIAYPGTEVHAEAKEKGLLVTSDWSKWLTEEGTHNPVIRTEHLTPEDVSAFVNEATRKFYLRPRMVFRTLWRSMTSYHEAKRVFKIMGHFWKFLLR